MFGNLTPQLTGPAVTPTDPPKLGPTTGLIGLLYKSNRTNFLGGIHLNALLAHQVLLTPNVMQAYLKAITWVNHAYVMVGQDPDWNQDLVRFAVHQKASRALDNMKMLGEIFDFTLTSDKHEHNITLKEEGRVCLDLTLKLLPGPESAHLYFG